MELTQIVLALTVFLCSLVTGLVWTFAIVVMPGIRTLGDQRFLQAFKVMDRIIQDSQPVFVMVWVGSILSLVASMGLALAHLGGLEKGLTLLAGALFLLGVHLPTFTINVPLNNRLQQTDLDSLSEAELAEARRGFESRWLRWNSIRTGIGAVATVLLLVVLVRL